MGLTLESQPDAKTRVVPLLIERLQKALRFGLFAPATLATGKVQFCGLPLDHAMFVLKEYPFHSPLTRLYDLTLGNASE